MLSPGLKPNCVTGRYGLRYTERRFASKRSNTLDKTGVMEMGLKSLGEDEDDTLGKGETFSKRQHLGNDPVRISIQKISAHFGADWPLSF